MGSPISSWENVEAYFTGFGGASVEIVFVLAVTACVGAILLGHLHESQSYGGLD